MQEIREGDICEIVDIGAEDQFFSERKSLIGKKISLEKIFPQRGQDMCMCYAYWADDFELFPNTHFKIGARITFSRIKLQKLKK